jgi:hypothetical protein
MNVQLKAITALEFGLSALINLTDALREERAHRLRHGGMDMGLTLDAISDMVALRPERFDGTIPLVLIGELWSHQSEISVMAHRRPAYTTQAMVARGHLEVVIKALSRIEHTDNELIADMASKYRDEIATMVAQLDLMRFPSRRRQEV